jgi:hypothetical protein
LVGNRQTAGLLGGRGTVAQRAPAASVATKAETRPVQSTVGPVIQRKNKAIKRFDRDLPGPMKLSAHHIEAKQVLKTILQEMIDNVNDMDYLRQKCERVNRGLPFLAQLGYPELVMAQHFAREVLGRIKAYSHFQRDYSKLVNSASVSSLTRQGLKKLGDEITFDLFSRFQAANKNMNEEVGARFNALGMKPLDKKSKKELSSWLRDVPAIKKLFSFHKERNKKNRKLRRMKEQDPEAYWRERHGQLLAREGVEPEWADGRSLADESIIRWDDKATAEIPKVVLHHLREADGILKLLVEPEVLAKIDRPEIVLCKNQKRSDSRGDEI